MDSLKLPVMQFPSFAPSEEISIHFSNLLLKPSLHDPKAVRRVL